MNSVFVVLQEVVTFQNLLDYAYFGSTKRTHSPAVLF